MNPGKQIEMMLPQEDHRPSWERAQEYLENPNRKDYFEFLRTKHGGNGPGARGRAKAINGIVGFPMAYVLDNKPEVINYMDTIQMQDYIDRESAKEAA
jgi:hypothetical protein